MTAQAPDLSRLGVGAGHPPGQPDVEETPKVAGEEDDHQGHGDKEPGLLELDAPADRQARRLDRRQDGGEKEEGTDDARRRGNEAQAHGAALAAAVADDAEQLDRQHRQDAGHEVEDQAAEHGQGKDDQKPAVRRGEGQGAFGAAFAVDQG